MYPDHDDGAHDDGIDPVGGEPTLPAPAPVDGDPPEDGKVTLPAPAPVDGDPPEDGKVTLPAPAPVDGEPVGALPEPVGLDVVFGVSVAHCPSPWESGTPATCTTPVEGSTATTAGANPTGVDPSEVHEVPERARVVTVPAVWSAVRTCPLAGSNTVATGPAPTGTVWVWVSPPCPLGP